MPAIHDAVVRAARWTGATLVPNVSVAMVNAASTIIVLSAAWFLWLVMQPSPIESVETVSVLPEDRVVDRSVRQALEIRRRIVMRRAAEVRVSRIWIDEGMGVQPVLDEWIYLPAGEVLRPPVKVYPPVSLNPGRYRYRVVLQSCSLGFQAFCKDTHAEDIDVLVEGHSPPDTSRPQTQRF